MNVETERADFEAECLKRGLTEWHLLRDFKTGEYVDPMTRGAWLGWQARAQQQAASGVAVAYAVRSNIREVHQLLLRRQDADDYAAALLRAAPTHNPAITEVTVMPLYAAPTPTAPAGYQVQRLIEAARCLGVAQQKGDADAASYWNMKVVELSASTTAPADVMADAEYHYTETQIANACAQAEIADSMCEGLLIALQEASATKKAPPTAPTADVTVDAERWRKVQKLAVLGAHRNGQRLNDKLLSGHQHANRVMFSVLLPASNYTDASTHFAEAIDAARVAEKGTTK